jgi:hypothetical protein
VDAIIAHAGIVLAKVEPEADTVVAFPRPETG